MYDPAGCITAVEICSGILFGFKLLDSSVLVHHLPAPERDKSAVRRPFYSAVCIFDFIGHSVCILILLSHSASEARDDRYRRRRRLGRSCRGTVAKIAKGYNGYGLPISDVISEGNVGLILKTPPSGRSMPARRSLMRGISIACSARVLMRL
jgi:hypothetical protein